MINNLPVLPDSIGIVLVIAGILAVMVYVMTVVRELKRDKIVKRLEKRVKESSKSDRLYNYYIAVAYGDKADRDYWYDTAKKFM